jgi:hypothetical protein
MSDRMDPRGEAPPLRELLEAMATNLDEVLADAYSRGCIQVIDAMELREMLRALLAGSATYTADRAGLDFRGKRMSAGAPVRASNCTVQWMPKDRQGDG